MAAGPGSQQGDAIPPAPQELATAHALARRTINGSGVCLYFTKNSHKRYEIVNHACESIRSMEPTAKDNRTRCARINVMRKRRGLCIGAAARIPMQARQEKQSKRVYISLASLRPTLSLFLAQTN